MKHLFVSYEIAKLLKDNCFNEDCIAFYKFRSNGMEIFPAFSHIGFKNSDRYDYISEVAAPINKQITDWFREKHILIEIKPLDGWDNWIFKITGEDIMSPFLDFPFNGIEYPTYYEALENAILEAIKLI